jgi:8-oxo-dGTP pyrophosphatase MutT (NUDIX family)
MLPRLSHARGNGDVSERLDRAWRALHRLALKGAYLGLRLSWRVYHPITLGVRVILTRDGEVLLVRHTYRPGWFLPGGGVHRRESLERAARREAREEAGATLGELRLLGVYSNFEDSKSDHVAVFGSTEVTLSGKHDDEIAELGWFPVDALPMEVSPGTYDRIAEWLLPGGLRSGKW